MKINVLIVGLMFALISCGGGETTAPDNSDQAADTGVQSVEIPITNSVLLAEDGIEKTVCNMGVEGMMCSIGCAGKIERTLANLAGVKACKVNFDDKVAVIEFDQAQLSEQDMIAAVQEIHDGQYSVTGVEVQEYKQTTP